MVRMADDSTIRAIEVKETSYGEKAVIESPYEAKEFINAMPWQDYEDEVEEYGSLRDKLETRRVDPAAIDAAEDFDWTDDFSAHSSWDPNALGYEEGAWTIDADSFDEAAEFFEFCGYKVEIGDGVEL